MALKHDSKYHNVYEFITGNKKRNFYTDDDMMYQVDYDMELLQFWYDTDVVIDDDMVDFECTARRAYYQMRGRRITEQQAFEMIRRTDMYAPWSKCKDCNDYVNSMNFQNWWTSPHLPAYYGWVHPNGIVGSDAITQKFANAKEFVEEWTNYLYRFPFLDLVIGVSRWNELPKYAWDDFNTYMFLPYDDFPDNIEAGIWVHDGTLEIMSPDRTVKKYKEYEKLYSENDHRVYRPEYYTELRPDDIDKDLALKCFRHYGVDEIPANAFREGGGFITSRLKAALDEANRQFKEKNKPDKEGKT